MTAECGGRPDVCVGTCGFAEAQARTWADFDAVEIQQTFYEPPQLITARRWRAAAPPGFRFSLKAWQLLTHEPRSPTYRRLRTPLSEAERAQAGGLRWNELTRRAWQRTAAIADALRAEAIVFQTPPSFTPSPAHIARLRHFFRALPRGPWRLVFEPRGDGWHDALLAPLLEELDLVHGTDPFLRPALGGGMRYYRLHGRPAYHYGYRYRDEDLARLQGWLDPVLPNRVLFNNRYMAEDARRFRRRLGRA